MAKCQIQRLTQPASSYDATGGQIASCHAGSWYDASQSGLGLFIEVLGAAPTAACWRSGTPIEWRTALDDRDRTDFRRQRHADGNADQRRRFPARFNPAQVTQQPWGTMTFRAIDANTAAWTWNSTVAGFGSGSLSLTRLTS